LGKRFDAVIQTAEDEMLVCPDTVRADNARPYTTTGRANLASGATVRGQDEWLQRIRDSSGGRQAFIAASSAIEESLRRLS
jgi:hypothetical protein